MGVNGMKNEVFEVRVGVQWVCMEPPFIHNTTGSKIPQQYSTSLTWELEDLVVIQKVVKWNGRERCKSKYWEK